MSTCAHTICRTTEPCRYGAPGTTDTEARAIYARRTRSVNLSTHEGGNDFPVYSDPI